MAKMGKEDDKNDQNLAISSLSPFLVTRQKCTHLSHVFKRTTGKKHPSYETLLSPSSKEDSVSLQKKKNPELSRTSALARSLPAVILVTFHLGVRGEDSVYFLS